jgi:hypothetical protein
MPVWSADAGGASANSTEVAEHAAVADRFAREIVRF